jgi:hypothetical protein
MEINHGTLPEGISLPHPPQKMCTPNRDAAWCCASGYSSHGWNDSGTPSCFDRGLCSVVTGEERAMANDAASTGNEEPAESAGGALGLLFVASPLIVMAGLFQIIKGLSAIINDSFFVVPPHYAYHLAPTVWGWIDLLLGILAIFTGVFLWSGMAWPRIVTMILALLSAVANFFSLPYYPVWSLLIIALDVVLIWSMVAYSRDLDKLFA